MNIKFRITGIEDVKAFISSLPRGVKMAASRAFAEYVIGNSSHGLKHEPVRITHDENNPYIWQSEKQRKAFFASDGFGAGIPTQRTGEMSAAWSYTESNSDWGRVNIINDSGYAGFVMGNAQQDGHKQDGWRYYLDVVQSNMAGAMRSALSEVNKWLKTKAK